MKRREVYFVITSHHYTRLNGPAEAAVNSIKHLILETSGNIDCEELDRGLLKLRNTLNFSGRAPVQIMYGHPIRSCIPAHPPPSVASEDRHAAACTENVRRQYNHHARPLPRLSIGQFARIQDPKSHRRGTVEVLVSHGMS